MLGGQTPPPNNTRRPPKNPRSQPRFRYGVGEITPDRVAALHYRLHETPIMANQAVDVLSRLYNRAAASDDPPATGNPCRFIKKYPSRSRERFLTEREFARLGAVLDELAAAGRISASARTAIRQLMLTGCRRSEVLTLKWEDVDFEHDQLRLRDSKTGAREVPLSPAVRKILAGLPRTPDNPWVISGSAPGRHLGNLNPSWDLVRENAGLTDVRIHDLRHPSATYQRYPAPVSLSNENKLMISFHLSLSAQAA